MKETAIQAVKGAGEIIKKHFFEEKDITWKGEKGRNPVTEVDHLCEEEIVSIIKEKFPEYNILTEEKLSEDKKSEYTWIIDPLDGTNNYTRQIPFVSSGVSLMKNKELILSVSYDPFHDELFHAEKGKGAYLNGKRIKVSNRELRASAMSFSQKALIPAAKLKKKVPVIKNLGCVHLHICYVACGRLDAFLAKGIFGPWDFAPYIIVKEAGGKVTTMGGKEMDIFGKTMLASNGRIHNELLSIVNSRE